MSISCKCPSCSAVYEVPDAWLGKKGKCKKCGNQITIQPDTPPPTPDANDELDLAKTIRAGRKPASPGFPADNPIADRDDPTDKSGQSYSTQEIDYAQTIRARAPSDSKPSPASDAPQPPPDWELSAGDAIDGRYLVTKRLGRGGMGAVYKAVDRETEIELAVKVLLPELASSPNAIRDLKKEVAIAQQLTHQNLLRVNHLGISDEHAYLIMEYIDGEDLEAYRLRNGGQLSEDDCRRVLNQLVAGLDHLHERGIVHLDIKPQNIMVTQAGEVKLTDFGISRTIKDQIATRDHEHIPVGSLCFMSPEQLRGGICDRRTDIYALGIMLHQLLTGAFPFSTRSKDDIVDWHLGPEFEPVILKGLWADIVSMCVVRDPADRFDRCADLRTAVNCIPQEAPASGKAPQRSGARHSGGSGSTRNLLTLADSDFEAGDFEGADAYYRRMLEEDPTLHDAWFGKARIYAATRHVEQAQGGYQRAALNPDKLLKPETLISYLKKAKPRENDPNAYYAPEDLATMVVDFCTRYTDELLNVVVMDGETVKAVFDQRHAIFNVLECALMNFPSKSLATGAARIAKKCLSPVRVAMANGGVQSFSALDFKNGVCTFDGTHLPNMDTPINYRYRTINELCRQIAPGSDQPAYTPGRGDDPSYGLASLAVDSQGGGIASSDSYAQDATLRFVRNTSTGQLVSFKIHVDGRLVSKLGYGKTAEVTVRSGRHRIKVTGGGAFKGAETTINLQPNDIYTWTVGYTMLGAVKLERNR